MSSISRLAKLKHRPSCYHFPSMPDKFVQRFLEVEQLWLVPAQGHHVDTEHGLHLGLLVEVIEYDF